MLTRDLHAFAQRHEKVVIAHQFYIEAPLFFQAFGEQLRNGKHHILFPFALGTDSTGILSTVPWVNDNNDVSSWMRVQRRCFTWNHWRIWSGFGANQIQNQAMALAVLRRQKEAV
ncbi:hypothetical protein D3C78_1486020 [compost metagenome]